MWEDDDRKDSVIDMGQPLLIEEAEAKKAKGNYGADDSKSKDVESGDIEESNYADSDAESKDKAAEPKEIGARMSNVYFHLVMTLASCYIAMLLTSWGAGSTISTTGKTSMYVNIVCQYATAVLFWWTLCAPMICPSRFVNDEDED